ncbi:hypothetical protein BRD18_05465 [Halobacteriales archaeon SW_7_71_33]|nr:MAG: hypothetical protein BRD18_05465 [Halobacteriales archaeon SW_7_71_33]
MVCMAEYHVTPAENMWQLKYKGGKVVSNHRKKQPAVKAGKRKAGEGDTLVVHKSNGRIQYQRNY